MDPNNLFILQQTPYTWSIAHFMVQGVFKYECIEAPKISLSFIGFTETFILFPQSFNVQHIYKFSDLGSDPRRHFGETKVYVNTYMCEL